MRNRIGKKESILIVDDDEGTRRSLSLILGKKGYRTETAETGQEAIVKAQGSFFHAALLDIRLPDTEGLELINPLKTMHPDMEVIMVTAYASLQNAVRAVNERASAYITKPINIDYLLIKIREALKKKRQVIEVRRLYEAAKIELAEHKRKEKKIRQLAYHDTLTGLPNRVLFNDRLTLALAHAHRNQQKMALMFLDLDHFKHINDTLGHRFGDQFLQVVGDRLTRLLRRGDTVARMGGDEFMMLLPEISKVKDSEKIAQKILKAFRKPFVLDGHKLFVTSSIGIAIYPTDGEDADTLIRIADMAMYRAKDLGRDNYQCYKMA